MKTGRDDLDALVRVTSIPETEPTFLLRAQDAQAATTVRAWIQLQLAAGCSHAVLEQAARQADAMAAWPVKKTPGGDHLSEGESKQLSYAFSRRVWNLGDLTPEGLAESRGYARGLREALDMLRDILPDVVGEKHGLNALSITLSRRLNLALATARELPTND